MFVPKTPPLLHLPSHPFVFPLHIFASLCVPLLPFASLCFPLRSFTSLCFPLLPFAPFQSLSSSQVPCQYSKAFRSLPEDLTSIPAPLRSRPHLLICFTDFILLPLSTIICLSHSFICWLYIYKQHLYLVCPLARKSTKLIPVDFAPFGRLSKFFFFFFGTNSDSHVNLEPFGLPFETLWSEGTLL